MAAGNARGIKSLLACPGRRQHFAAQNGVDAGLVAFALGLEPVEHVGVHAGGDLTLAGTVEMAARRALPLLVGHLRDVAGVDLGVGAGGEGLQPGAVGLGERRQRVKRIANHSRFHSAAALGRSRRAAR